MFPCTDLWKVLGYLFDVSSFWPNDKAMQPAVYSHLIQHYTVCLQSQHLTRLPVTCLQQSMATDILQVKIHQHKIAF